MQRYFVKEKISNPLILKDFNQVHHIRNVMKMKLGDKTVVCDLEGRCFYMTIKELHSDTVIFTQGQALPRLDRKFHVTLAQSLILKDHFELACQKATELGVDTIIPIKASRSIIDLNSEKPLKGTLVNLKQESSEASSRQTLCHIEDVMQLKDLNYSYYDVILVAYENENTLSLKEALKTLKNDVKLLIVIGPEGGFTEDEIAFLESFGAKTVSLGSKILRSETAALYVLSVLSYEMEMSNA